MSDLTDQESYIHNLDVITPVEVEQIPCSDSPLDSSEYLDLSESRILGEDEDYHGLSQLNWKGRRKLYECTAPGCNKAYSKPALLTYHMDTAHLKLKWFTCIYKNCNKSFYYPSHMKRHLRTHGPKQFYCELCYSTFSRLENLKVHQRKCRLLLMCSVCGETFITNSDIQKHRQSHCVYLKCLYKDCYEHLPPDSIREHLSQHVNVVKCPLCIAMFLEQGNLEKHMLKDHKTEMCCTADYTSDVDVESWFKDVFSDLQSLDSEASKSGNGSGIKSTEVKSTDGAKIRKTTDSIKDADKNEAVKEVTSDESSKPSDKVDEVAVYKCQEPGCSYSTPTPRWLTKHTLRHRKKDSLKCTVCSKTLADKWSLTLHLSSHQQSSAQQFSCSFCKKTFPSQSRLSAHCQKYHPESRIWKCDECQMSFSTSKRLMVHYRKHVTG